jgi:hypothetical protein
MMPVYVDPLFDTEGMSVNWPYPEACHLMADTEEELHTLAARVGMRRAWFQACPPHSIAHYDLTRRRRAMAVRLGAIEVCAGFRPSRRHFRWASTNHPITQYRETPDGVPVMKIPSHWPNGTPMALDDRMHFMTFRCGIVLCANCGTVVAKCACGKEDDVNMLDACHECDPSLASTAPSSYNRA